MSATPPRGLAAAARGTAEDGEWPVRGPGPWTGHSPSSAVPGAAAARPLDGVADMEHPRNQNADALEGATHARSCSIGRQPYAAYVDWLRADDRWTAPFVTLDKEPHEAIIQ